ncbi:dihydroorotate dehydrogenase B (NAD(+)), electron transfer subunit [Clostridia bacterium]|nr:dihydroorotate dehydrogenase B (NAD(+)), electron transfer subunit [Clostridia bacterium]
MTHFKSRIVCNAPIVQDVWLMTVEVPETPKAGQFYNLHVEGELLPRPLSVCESDGETVTFAYQIVGKGTKKLTKLSENHTIALTGALGNGFDLDAIRPHRRVALVSGGIGIAPMVQLSKQLAGRHEVSCFCGFSEHAYLVEKLPNVKTAIGGFVTDLFDAADFDIVCACGPKGFTKAIVRKCAGAVPLLVSLDEHMACGVGACLVCACKTTNGVKRCCADGPVFWGEELAIDNEQ